MDTSFDKRKKPELVLNISKNILNIALLKIANCSKNLKSAKWRS